MMSALDLVIMNRQSTDNPLYVYNNNGDRIDISDHPVIGQPSLIDSFRSYLDNVDMSKQTGRYMFNNVVVPRVTTILDYCSGNSENLMMWAAKLGNDYKYEKERVLNIGTKVHKAIEEYITAGSTYCLRNLNSGIKREVLTSFSNFLSWYNKVIYELGWSVEIITTEVPLICPWFGGTADVIMEINGKKYVVDFKTSKKLTQEYFIQVSVYKWILDNFYFSEYGTIDGIGLLRFDKKKSSFEDIFLESRNVEDFIFMNHCQQVFSLALNLYYSMKSNEVEMNTIKKNKKEEKKYDLQNS